MKHAVLLLGVVLAGQAHAAGRRVVDDEAPVAVVERRHQVRLEQRGAVAHARVRRTYVGQGELVETLRLPTGATVTGFRLVVGGQVVSGRVEPAAVAALRYDELRSPGAGLPRHVGLLAWQGLGEVGLSVFPLFAGEELVVELELTLPLDYQRGRYWLDVPRGDGARVELDVVADGAVWVEGDELPLVGDDRQQIAITPGAIDVATGRLGVLALGPGRVAVRSEMEVAPALGQLPRRARVVFVVDGSWSQGEAGIAAELEVVRGYLAHVPDAEVEIVSFARRPRRVFGRFVPAGEVGQPVIVPANGSDPTAALGLAAALLAGETRPARLVLLGDGILPRAWTPERGLAALARLPRHAVVHVVSRIAADDGLVVERVRDEDLATLADAHGGQMLRVAGTPADPHEMAAQVLGLVRPVRLDVERHAFVAAGEIGVEPALAWDEGAGARAFDVLEVAPDAIVVEGRVWARPVALRFTVDPTLQAAMPALVAGADVASDDELERLGLAHGLVTPRTSFLAEPAGAEASSLGLEAASGASLRGASVGYSQSSSCGCCTGGEGHVFDGESVLAELIAPAARRCGVKGGAVTLETGPGEIMDVRSASRCLAEAVWALRLPEGEWEGGEWTVSLEP